MIREVAENIAGHRGVIVNVGTAARLGIEDGDTVVFGGVKLEVIHTPGHTPGHVAVRIRSRGEEAVITGDLLNAYFPEIIRGIQEETGTTIEIEDDGTITISAVGEGKVETRLDVNFLALPGAIKDEDKDAVAMAEELGRLVAVTARKLAGP